MEDETGGCSSSKRKVSSMTLDTRQIPMADTVPLETWLKGQNAAEEGFFLPILDGRSVDNVKQHGSLSHPMHRVVPIPIQEWKQRSFELPARHVPFLVLVQSEDAMAASDFLIGPKEIPSSTKMRKRSQKPWRVQAFLYADKLDPTVLEKYHFSIQNDLSLLSETFPLPRLWEPDPMIKNILLPTLQLELKQKFSSKETVRILDLASGAGRDVVFLAEEILASSKSIPFKVEALDHRYNEKETGIVNGFFHRRRIEAVTECIQIDLSQWSTLQHLLSSSVMALYCVRFWKPSLVEALASSSDLAPGTLFAISHFCKPSEGAEWKFAHPSEKTVLERNQLAGIFQGDWEILHDGIALDSDHVRTMIHFVARKK
jgi:hypothetical protein